MLTDWLDRLATADDVPDRIRVREGVVRALTVGEARPSAVPALIRALDSPDAQHNQSFAWAAGNELGALADDSVYDATVRLASQRSLGTGRQMLMYPLGRSKTASATDALLAFARDDDVSGHAADALVQWQAIEWALGSERHVPA